MNNIDIYIPTDVILELQKELNNGINANQWWQSLTKEQQNFLLQAGFNFLQKQKIKQYQLDSELLIPTLIQLSKSAGTIELFQDNNGRFSLLGSIDRNLYGVRGKCYSQSPEFIGAVCEEFLGGYSGESAAHKHGQKTVDIICFALNALPGITAAQTPFYSVADVGLRWDVIIQWNDCYFPIQVKSSFIAIEKALETGSLGNYAQDKIENFSTYDYDFFESEERFLKNINKSSLEEIENKKAYYKALRENRSHIRRKYRQSEPLYIWAAQNREAVELLVELFANTFKIDNNIKQYQEQAVAAYLNKYPKHKTGFEIRKEKINKNNEKKKEQSEQIIQALKEQIQGKQKRIRNRKAKKRPVVVEHTQALKLAEDALKHIHKLIEAKIKSQWYRDQTLFNQIENLRNLDKETNSPMLQQTEELFKLIQDFTEIQFIEFDIKDLSRD